MRAVACDGCGRAGGSALPLGWVRILVKKRNGDPNPRIVAKLDLCSPTCASEALLESFQ